MNKNKNLSLTLDELRILDNELYASQCKLSKFSLLHVDGTVPSQEQLKYRDIVNDLRSKVGNLLKREAINTHLNTVD